MGYGNISSKLYPRLTKARGALWKQGESKVIAILKQSDMSLDMEEKPTSKLILLKWSRKSWGASNDPSRRLKWLIEAPQPEKQGFAPVIFFRRKNKLQREENQLTK